MSETSQNTATLHRFTPLVLLALLVLAFGLMIPWLGYGFDEWHFIYYSTRGAQGLAELFHYDGHPQATWSYIESFKILGYSPLIWHLFSLLWRWLAVVSFWLCLKQIWPVYHRQTLVAAALFAIYPLFTLQVYPITFFEIWFGYTLLFLSFYFTILAVQRPDKQWVFMLVAILLAVGHVFTKEYAWFVELMRPVFIWLAVPSKDALRKKILQVAKTWLPFFAIFVSYLIWRGFIYVPLRKYFQVQSSVFTNPVPTLLTWAADIIPDISIVLITSWYETFRSEYLYLVRSFTILVFVLMIFVIVMAAIYIRKLDGAFESGDSWATQAFLLGLPSLLFGVLPFYVSSYSIHLTETPLNSRFAIGMLPGAALIVAAILQKLISQPGIRIWVTAVILSLAVTWHVRYTNDYREIWAYQSSLLQQLTWRIPGLEKDTALFIWQPAPPQLDHPDPGIALYADFQLAMAVNSIYQVHPDPAKSKLDYWYYFLSGDSIDIPKDASLHEEHATTFFDGNTRDSLLFYYDPQNGRCLHLVTPEDQYYKQYPEALKTISASMVTDPILPALAQDTQLRDDIWNTSQPTWCFYYQQAELARQFGHWDKIPPLWEAASGNDLHTSFGTETIPFIDGFARTGDWQQAKEITIHADKISKGMNSILCPLWLELEASTPASEERDATIQQIRNTLHCGDQ